MSPAALARCGPGRVVATLAGEALGTSWRVSFAAAPGTATAPLQTAIRARLADIDAEMSQWQPRSVVSRFNRAPAGTWMTLPPDLAAVIAAAGRVAEASGGAFDPTHGRAAALLGYGAVTTTRPPTSAELDDARASAGWDRLAFDPAARRLRQPGGLWLDLSGIGKGFAVDAVADLLGDHGHRDALVEIGGELVGRGLKPDGQPWWVDLETPPGMTPAPLRVALHEGAVATSGDYVRGAHTLDPRTGHPLAAATASVSVLHPQAMLADAWATALTVVGPAAAMTMADRYGLPARIIAHDGADMLSAPLEALLS